MRVFFNHINQVLKFVQCLFARKWTTGQELAEYYVLTKGEKDD